MELAGGALGASASVGEGQLLAMTASAGFFSIDGHPLVVKQIPAEFDLGGGQRVAGGNGGAWEALWKFPVEVRGDEAGGEGDGEDKRLKQPALRFGKYRNRRGPRACGAAWRAAKYRGTI